ncbi:MULTISPECIES: hypothetical protein [unclassified Halomonas]|uniref:hypothetical protein n=1 Tax=unclassified Halomonas TaxID=2609666 RepID=UPI002076AB96|nr:MULTISPECIES: hypothetical protein [unclassified Halomonas]
MADIDFPEGLPTPLDNGRSVDHIDAVMTTQMASGRSRSRQVFTNTPSRISVEWLFNAGQVQLFEAWYWAPYNRENPSLGGIQARVMPFNIRLRTPIGLRSYEEVKFAEKYQGPTLVSKQLWSVKATLEIAKRPVLPPSSLEFPKFILYSATIDYAVNKKWPPTA